MSIDNDEEFRRMQEWLGACNDDSIEKPKTEEGLTVEQTRDFAKRGGWILIYLLLVAVGLAIAAVASAANVATITFTAATKFTDGTPFAAGTTVSYNVYQGAKGSTSKTKIGTITTTNTTVSSGLLTGQEYCFEVTALVGGVEGDHSNEGCKNFVGTPGTVVITVT